MQKDISWLIQPKMLMHPIMFPVPSYLQRNILSLHKSCTSLLDSLFISCTPSHQLLNFVHYGSAKNNLTWAIKHTHPTFIPNLGSSDTSQLSKHIIYDIPFTNASSPKE